MRLEKIQRSLGSRLAQQVARHVSYNTEFGFELAYKVVLPVASPVIRTQGYLHMPQRIQPDNPQQLALFISTTKDVSFGVCVVWKDRYAWKTKVSPLDNHITADAALFAVGMATKNFTRILTNADRHHAEIATESRVGLAAI